MTQLLFWDEITIFTDHNHLDDDYYTIIKIIFKLCIGREVLANNIAIFGDFLQTIFLFDQKVRYVYVI